MPVPLQMHTIDELTTGAIQFGRLEPVNKEGGLRQGSNECLKTRCPWRLWFRSVGSVCCFGFDAAGTWALRTRDVEAALEFLRQ